VHATLPALAVEGLFWLRWRTASTRSRRRRQDVQSIIRSAWGRAGTVRLIAPTSWRTLSRPTPASSRARGGHAGGQWTLSQQDSPPPWSFGVTGVVQCGSDAACARAYRVAQYHAWAVRSSLERLCGRRVPLSSLHFLGRRRGLVHAGPEHCGSTPARHSPRRGNPRCAVSSQP